MLIYGKSTYLLLVTAIKLHNLPHPLINGLGTLLAAMHNLNSLYLMSRKYEGLFKNCEIGSVTAIDSCSILPLFNKWFGNSFSSHIT